ncbi:MAG: hypothetical protein KBG15_17410 [Kofleriaceae bacterium]|nr:hypothetical protein [Kofleriaceae bacterium]
MTFIFAAIAASVAPAWAQPANTPPFAMAPTTTRPIQNKTAKRQVWTAIGLSIGTLWAGAIAGGLGENATTPWVRNATGGFATAATVLGPSIGQWYAGQTITPGLAMRLGAVAGVVGLAVYDPHLDHVGTLFGIVGAVALFQTGLVWDIVTLPRAVRRMNREHGLALTPMASNSATGLALAGRF